MLPLVFSFMFPAFPIPPTKDLINSFWPDGAYDFNPCSPMTFLASIFTLKRPSQTYVYVDKTFPSHSFQEVGE